MDSPDKAKFDFSINNVTFTVGLLITIACMVAAHFVAAHYNYGLELRDYLSVFTCGIICTTLFYHSKNVVLTHRYHKEKLDFEKQKLIDENKRRKLEFSLLVTSEWFKPTVFDCADKARRFINSNKSKLNNGVVFIEILDADIENRKAVIMVLNYFEHISLLIKKDLIEEDTVKDAFKTVFCDYYSSLKPYIEERQKKSGRFLMNYEEIAMKWSKN
jgi:Domain of unknown function (DUF4760)